MNTIATDRLYSDPRLKRLAREVGCPAKALGLLMWMWHGTQNLGVVVASECDILDTFPQGLRTPQKLLSALVRSGWLEDVGDAYRIIGNQEHVQARETMSDAGRRGAEKRWGKKDGVPHDHPIAEKMASPSEGHRVQMTSLPPTSPSLPPSLPKERDPTRAREEQESGQKPLGASHPEVAFFEARHRELFPGALAYGAKERARAAEVIRRCAENGRRWQDVLEAYSDPRWSFALGSLDWLRDHLGELTQWIADGKPKRGKPEEAPARVQPPSAEETSRRIAERNKRWQDEDAKSAEVAKRFFANGGKL